MRCHRCRAPANVEIRRSRTAYCAKCYPDWFRQQVQDRIDHERMFRRDQRVLVAVSGGKDSLALWHVLLKQGYQADGMYIRLGIGDYSRRSQEKSEAFAARHGLKLHQVELKEEHGFAVPDLLDARSGKPCSACGTVKRYHFNKVAAEKLRDRLAQLGCALPHVMTFHALASAIVKANSELGGAATSNLAGLFVGGSGHGLLSLYPNLERRVDILLELAHRMEIANSPLVVA